MQAIVHTLLVGPAQPLAGTRHSSAIGKRAVSERLWLGPLGLAGDEQADRRHHGGPDKAVHHYAFDHYAYWIGRIGFRDVLTQPGAFGENLSTQGVTENDVCIGDIFRFGAATMQVSQARQPCWKLNARFGDSAMALLVQQSGNAGWYYRVLEPGWVSPGDTMLLLERPHPEWPLSDILDILYRRPLDRPALAALSTLEMLPASWRKLFERRLLACEVEDWTARLSGHGR
ncbi:MAG TPA: MOSC domain-containing protein [Noviherbaspirillum sp.]|nr:MOSC domain-containing protein [Noviherbaspirillum sp.]